MFILCLKGFRYDDFNEFLGQNWLDLDVTIILLLFPHQVIRIEHLSPPNGLLGLISSSSSTAFQLGLDKLILFTIVYVVVGPVFLDLVVSRFSFLRNGIVVLNFKLHQSLRVWSFIHACNQSLIVDVADWTAQSYTTWIKKTYFVQKNYSNKSWYDQKFVYGMGGT